MRGGAFLLLGAGLVAAAFVLREPVLVWPGAFLALLPALTLAATLVSPPRLRATRRVTPPQVEAGQALAVEVDLLARRTGLAGSLRVDDHLPPSFGGGHPIAVPALARGTVTRVGYECRPRRRGRFRLDRLSVHYGDLLGLTRRTLRLPTATSVLVTPPVLPLRPTRQVAAGTSGETPIPQTAVSGPDDVLVRDYQPRDDVRRIHWPSTARTGQLMVRREEQAWDPTAWVILDSRSASHGGAQATSASFEWLVTLASSVGAHLIDEGYVVGIADADALTHTSRGREHLQPRQAWLEHLVDAVLTGEDDLGPATRVLARQSTGHLVVALLGSLDADDAARLVGTADAHRGWALLIDRPLTGEQAEARARGLRVLAAHGWAVALTEPGSDPAVAWAALGAAVHSGEAVPR